MTEDKISFADLYKMFRKKEESKPQKIFNSREEYLIVASLIGTLLEKDIRVAIYEVENFENLFDYADVFMRLKNAGIVPLFGQNLKFITVTTYPHDDSIVDAVEEAINNGFKPVVAYFVGDFLPSGETTSSDVKELIKVLAMALFKKVCYVILFTTNPMILYDNITLARYGVVLRDFAPKVISYYFPEKMRYANVVGFTKILKMNDNDLISYIKSRRLPTPHTLEELERDTSFRELIIPPAIKEFIRVNIINILKRDITMLSSILLLGPSGSGKTTLAYTIARELGVPAYVVRVELIGSKWLGETERIANQTMLLANDMSPAVIVFRDAELILGERKGGGEESMVYERVRAIISSWLRSTKRRFFAVFTISNPKQLPEYILYDATFGIFKLPILPPLNKSDRKAMLSLFLSKLAKKYNLVFDPLSESIDEALETVAEETWAYTARELMDVAKTAINLVLDRSEKVVTKEIIQLAKKYKEIDRIARISIMKDTVNACKKVGIPENLLVDIYKFEQEVEKLRALAMAEEAKKKSIARLSTA